MSYRSAARFWDWCGSANAWPKQARGNSEQSGSIGYWLFALRSLSSAAIPRKPFEQRSNHVTRYNILILGASYGSLLASKLLYGGHSVHLVCLPAEADLINAEGFRVRLPIRGRKDQVEIDSRKLPGKVSAG